MARPNWEYVRIDVLLPGHPKLDGLTYTSKWTLIEAWCHCGQYLTDGFVRDAVWKRLGTASARQQLVERGLAHRVSGGYMMHDYLEHQRSRAEVAELKEKRRKAGAKGGRAKASAKQELEHLLEQEPEQTSSKPLAEAEAEAEAEVVGGPVRDLSSRRNARGDLTDLIIQEIRKATGRDISASWADSILAGLLAGRDVTDPAAYLTQAIRSEPNPHRRFLPLAAASPAARTPGEAARTAGLNGHAPADEATVHTIAALARQALTTEDQ